MINDIIYNIYLYSLGQHDILEFLSKNGADVDAVNDFDDTALTRTIKTGNSMGSNFYEIKFKELLLLFIISGRFESVKLLVEVGANVDATNGAKFIPLIVAVAHSNRINVLQIA